MQEVFRAPRSVEEIQKEYHGLAAALGEKTYMAKVIDQDVQNLTTRISSVHKEMDAAIQLSQKQQQEEKKRIEEQKTAAAAEALAKGPQGESVNG